MFIPVNPVLLYKSVVKEGLDYMGVLTAVEELGQVDGPFLPSLKQLNAVVQFT